MNPMQNNPMAGMMQSMVQKTMGNNPVFALVNAMRNGNNPQDLLQQMAQKDPRVAQVMKIVNGKSSQELREYATNMAKEAGTTVDQVTQSLGFQIPQNK